MTARIGAPKTGGRKRGSIDREARKLLTDKMSADLMFVYSKLGGRAWLLEFAEKNPGEFIRQGLSRLWPAPQKDDEPGEPGGTYTQINFDSNPTEVARRVAFILARGMHDDPSVAVRDISAEVTPQRAPDAPPEAYLNPLRWTPPTDYPDMVDPGEDPAKALWIEEIALTPEQRRDAALVRETKEVTLANYHGGPGEQSGPGPDRPAAGRKPTISEIRRRQLL
ncbi:hypothetical protein [Pseudomonas sp. LB3P14]